MKVLHIPTATEYEFRATRLGGFYDGSELDWIFMGRSQVCYWSERFGSSKDRLDPRYGRRYEFVEVEE